MGIEIASPLHTPSPSSWYSRERKTKVFLSLRLKQKSCVSGQPPQKLLCAAAKSSAASPAPPQPWKAALAGSLPRVGLVWVLPHPQPWRSGAATLRPHVPVPPLQRRFLRALCVPGCVSQSVRATPPGAQQLTSGWVLWEELGLGLWFPPFRHPPALHLRWSWRVIWA